jgi:hypothetical protein
MVLLGLLAPLRVCVCVDLNRAVMLRNRILAIVADRPGIALRDLLAELPGTSREKFRETIRSAARGKNCAVWLCSTASCHSQAETKAVPAPRAYVGSGFRQPPSLDRLMAGR